MSGGVAIYDAHCHLQDERLAEDWGSIKDELEAIPVRKAVVNGTRSQDWRKVAELAAKHPWIVPSYGLHPWYANQNCENWREDLERYIRDSPAGVGEVGLDRWIEGYDSKQQEEVFVWQLRLAAEVGRPVSIHCLKAWGRLLEILQEERVPCGFLLHSYGGPAEMVRSFVELGGYFSVSGYFAHERKQRQREAFRTVPMDRLLVETDAPDMLPPPGWIHQELPDKSNHPANIVGVYQFAAELYGITVQELAQQVEENFKRLFGVLAR